jgi:hypothetical protein
MLQSGASAAGSLRLYCLHAPWNHRDCPGILLRPAYMLEPMACLQIHVRPFVHDVEQNQCNRLHYGIFGPKMHTQSDRLLLRRFSRAPCLQQRSRMFDMEFRPKWWRESGGCPGLVFQIPVQVSKNCKYNRIWRKKMFVNCRNSEKTQFCDDFLTVLLEKTSKRKCSTVMCNSNSIPQYHECVIARPKSSLWSLSRGMPCFFRFVR